MIVEGRVRGILVGQTRRDIAVDFLEAGQPRRYVVSGSLVWGGVAVTPIELLTRYTEQPPDATVSVEFETENREGPASKASFTVQPGG